MASELRKRTLSAIVMVIVTVAAAWYGGMPFRAFSAAMALLIYYEWSKMTRLPEIDLRGDAFGWVAVVCISVNLAFGDQGLGVPLLGGFTITALLLKFVQRGSGWMPGGVLYAGLSGISLAAIRGADQLGLMATLFLFAVVWGTDILAYFFGRAIGGPKLAPRISPGKTWSGAIGGTVSGVVLGSALVLAFMSHVSVRTIALAFVLSVAAQIGDLFESFIKRRFGVKDSSHLIPGHGGVMDRVDGLVFACFAAFLLAMAHAAWTGYGESSVARFLFGL